MSESAARKNLQKLQRAIVDGLEDVKAQDIRVFNTEHLSPLFERVIVASGTSNRQTKALAASVRDQVRDAGFAKPRVEGEDNGEWIIVDCGAAVAHIMQPAIRQYYNLEEIWGEKPVRLKNAAAKPRAAGKRATGTREKAEPAATVAKSAPSAAGKASGTRAPARTAAKPSAKTPAKTPAKTAVKVPARTPARASAAPTPASKTASKSPARKSAAAGATGTASAPRKRAPSLQTVVVKPSASRSPAKAATKTVARSPARTAAKKAAPRTGR